MKAAVFHGPGRLVLEDLAVPHVGRADMLVKVRAASICGTDLRILQHGHFKIPSGVSRVLGHEFSGEIVSVGSDVTGFEKGDRVSFTPNIGCGSCDQCQRGFNQMCPDYDALGITIDGGFQEFVLIPDFVIKRGNVFRIPVGVTFQEAALLEPISCCHSGQNKVEVSESDIVVIVGAGPIGCIHAMLAKRRGAKSVIVANTREERLLVAKECGADHTINVSRLDLKEEVLRLTSQQGADVVITCVSKPEVVSKSIELLARHGRVNVFSGLGKLALPEIDVNAIHYKSLTMTGTTGSSNRDYLDVLNMMSEKPLNLTPLVSQTFELGQISDAIAHSSSRNGMKSLIVFDDLEL